MRIFHDILKFIKRGVNVRKICSIICFVLFLGALFFQIYVAITPSLSFRVFQKLGIISIEVIFLVISLLLSLPLQKNANKRSKNIRTVLYIILIMYVGNIVYLLFFDADFGRNIIFRNGDVFYQAISTINLKPFEMMKNYISAYRYGNILFAHLIVNLVGNLIIFAPLGILLPSLFKIMQKPIVYTFFVAITIVLSEFLQFYLSVGVCDIDDFILNFTGAMIVYGIYKIPVINRLWHKFIKQEK